MITTNIITLKLPTPPKEAHTTHRLPDIINNLIFAPILCDVGCKVTFSDQKVEVTKNDELLLEGWLDPRNRLWRVSLETTKNYYAVLDTSANVANLLY